MSVDDNPGDDAPAPAAFADNVVPFRRDVHEVILAPVREHSRKPDEAYSRIERYCAGPRLELFAREVTR